VIATVARELTNRFAVRRLLGGRPRFQVFRCLAGWSRVRRRLLERLLDWTRRSKTGHPPTRSSNGLGTPGAGVRPGRTSSPGVPGLPPPVSHRQPSQSPTDGRPSTVPQVTCRSSSRASNVPNPRNPSTSALGGAMADRRVTAQLQGGPETLLHRGAGRDLPPNPSRRGPARNSSSGAGAPAASFAPSSWPEEVAALHQLFEP